MPEPLQIEGEHVETDDYFFCKIGDSIPLIVQDDAVYDTDDIPSKPLALSSRDGLVFAAHASGFCVAKTKDVIAAAKEIKAKKSDSSVQELSVVDVDIGRVSILALSEDSRYISAVVKNEIHVFSVNSLLNKDKKPTFSCSVVSNHVKDMLWIKDSEQSFIVITDSGEVYHGAINKPLTSVMEKIDAVEKSVDGRCIAIGRKNNLTIFSSQFKEILQIDIPMDSFTPDNSASDTIKVESIRWVREDSIVVGCLQQTEGSEEENYFLQVIMSEDGKFMNDSSAVTAVQFNDLFPGMVDDIVPYGCGPHLFMNYLENCEFAFVSNRKNTDQHITLLSWSQGDNRVSVVDIERDSWLPRIELQENGDDNLVLGLCVDEASVYENVEVKIGADEHRELRPHCLLVCLTLEGKLVMFNVASISGCQRSGESSSSLSDDVQTKAVVSHSNLGEGTQSEEAKRDRAEQFGTVAESRESNSGSTNSAPGDLVVKDLTKNRNSNVTLGFERNLSSKPVDENDGQRALMDANISKPSGNSDNSQQETSIQYSSKDSRAQLGGTEKWKIASSDKVLEKNGQRDLMNANISKPFGNSENSRQETSTQHSSKDSLAQLSGTEKWRIASSDKILEKNSADTNKGEAVKTGSGVSHGISNPIGPQSNIGSGFSNARSPFFSPSSTSTKTSLSGFPLPSTNTANNNGSFAGNLGIRPSDSFTSSIGKAANFNQTMTSSEQNSSKQFDNVENIAKELDKLLEGIEETGGFRDIFTSGHRSSLEALEEGMRNLSDRSRGLQSISEEQLRETELLLDKTVQVLARKTHMEGIVRQTTDGQYWDMWNRQKLSSELDHKQQTILSLYQDLVNKMIELEKHFNTLELNLYGESSGANFASRALNCRSATPRHSQSLNAIHNATVSQLAAAEQLSDMLSRQMDVLSVKSPSSKKSSVKKKVFETIGMPCPDDSVNPTNIAKMFDSPPNKSVTHNEFRRSQLSSGGSEFETSRRRRDSLDRNWAKFEAPKTTVKRMPVKTEQQSGRGLFSSMDKRLVKPFKIEASLASHSKNLGVQDSNGGKSSYEKLNSDTIATSASFKWAGAIPETTQLQAQQYSRTSPVQGNNFLDVQNTSATSSPAPSLSSSFSSFRNTDGKTEKGHANAERSGSHVGYIGNRDAALVDQKVSGSQWRLGMSTNQSTQPQPTTPPIKFSPIPSIIETKLTKPGDKSSSNESTSKHNDQFSSSSGTVGTSASSSSLFPALSAKTLPVVPAEAGFGKVKDASKEVSQFPSAFPISSSAAPSNPISPWGSLRKDSSFMGSSGSFVQDTVKVGPKPSTDGASAETNLATSTQSSKNLAPSFVDKLKSEGLTPTSTSTEVPNSFGSAPGVSKTTTVVPDAGSNAATKQSTLFSLPSLSFSDTGGTNGIKNTTTAPTEKQPTAFSIPPVSLSKLGDTGSGKNISEAATTTTAQEDEMEEVASETNQSADFSLGSLAGFGIGSAVSAPSNRSNPFGVSLSSTPQNTTNSSPFTVPQGQLFRPASFSFSSPVPQQSQSSTVGATSGAFGSATSQQQPPAASGFGQPGQIGFGGQQALGSVLGSFGQSRQIGAGLPGSGFGSVPSSGGFLNAAGGGGGFATPTGGFAGVSGTSGGFAAAAPAGGGFAAAAGGGGFAAAAGSGGFAAAAPSGGGFAAAGSGGGGFGAFSNQGTGGFSTLGGAATGRTRPPSELFTQMRR